MNKNNVIVTQKMKPWSATSHCPPPHASECCVELLPIFPWIVAPIFVCFQVSGTGISNRNGDDNTFGIVQKRSHMRVQLPTVHSSTLPMRANCNLQSIPERWTSLCSSIPDHCVLRWLCPLSLPSNAIPRSHGCCCPCRGLHARNRQPRCHFFRWWWHK